MAKTTKLVGYGISFDMELVGGVKTADDFRKAAKSVQKSLNASENAVKQYQLKQEQLNQALQKGAITKKQYDQAMTTLAFREQRRVERLEKERRAVLGLDKQESILAKNRQNRARMAGMAAAGVSGLGLGGRAAGAARFLGGAAGLGGAATGLGLGFAGLAAIQQSVKAFADLEAKVASLKSLFGESLGEQLTNQFRNLAKTTILTNNQLIENAKTWASYGLTTDGLTDRLKRLGTVAGGNSEKFRALTIAFAQVNAQGKLMGQEKNQLINAGFSLQAVADAAGISMENFADAMKNGEIRAEHLNEALIKVTSEGGLFAGYLEKQAETINGKMTILTSTWEEFLQTLGEAERGPAGFFLDKMILAAETLKTSAEYFSGKNIFPFSTPAGKAIPGSAALGAAGASAQVDVGGLPKGFELLDILSFMGINSRMLGLSTTGPYPMGQSAVETPFGFSAIPNIDPVVLKNLEEASIAVAAQLKVLAAEAEAQAERDRKRAEIEQAIFDDSMKNFNLTQQEFANALANLRPGTELYDKMLEEFVTRQFTEGGERFVGPMMGSRKDQEDRAAKMDEIIRKEKDFLEAEVERAEEIFEREMNRLDAEEKQVEEQLRKDKALAKAPQGASFRGGSVEEFQFLRQMTQRSEEAQAIREAAAKAEAQRDRINGNRERAEAVRNNDIQTLISRIDDLVDKLQ